MAEKKTIWCLIKKYVIGTLVSTLLFGIGYTAYHVITSEPMIAQQITNIKSNEDQIKRLSEKIDSTQPAVIVEKIKNLETNLQRLETKTDYYRQKQMEQYGRLMERQNRTLELLIEIKNK